MVTGFPGSPREGSGKSNGLLSHSISQPLAHGEAGFEGEARLNDGLETGADGHENVK